MDDADLDEVIQEQARRADAHPDAPSSYRFANDDAHLNPSRWWFASSAFPMIAGTLGPVASAFSICALGRPWRQHYVPGSDVQKAPFHKDPPWLTIINALQLVIALIANAFLLLNMTRRVRFSIAQPATIVGWYMSAVCLLALCATAGGPLLEGIHPVDEYIWSQAFWYGIWAAILYFIDASLMAVTFYGASTDHYGKDFVLTASQRTLMLQTIMFLMYLLLGALVFSTIEGWNYLDGVYWADVTLFTVGFGDFAPSSVLGRALVIPYALVGIISLGLVIGSIRSMVLERGKRRLDARMAEKKRRKKVRNMTATGKDGILDPIDRDSAAPPDSRLQDVLSAEFERRRTEFQIMRKIQRKVSVRRRWMAMAISTGSWLVLWLLGAYIFFKTEKPYQPQWTYFDSFFFSFTALTTVGYGDVTPISNAGKSFFVFWSLLALPTMTVLISNAGDTLVKFIRDGTIYLGNITILPGEGGFSRDIKHVVNTLTCGRVFPEHDKPVVEKDDGRGPDEREDDGAASHSDNDADGGYGSETGLPDVLVAEETEARSRRARSPRPPSTFTSKVRQSLSRIRDPLEELPVGTDLFYLLISEIQVVSQHVRGSHPKQYSYNEWAWYLRLIGEDERSPDTHRKARPEPKRRRSRLHPDHAGGYGQGVGVTGGGTGGGEPSRAELEMRTKWSWVGNRSPLMGSKGESEWILERLCDRLREVVSAEGRRRKDEGKAPNPG